MYGPQWEVAPIAFSTGVGTQEVVVSIPKADLSCRKALRVEMTVTTANTDATDEMVAMVQFGRVDETGAAMVWDTYGLFDTVTGDQSPTSSAPYKQALVIQNRLFLESSEEAYQPTSSTSGGDPLAEGSVRNGWFPGKVFFEGVWVAALRVLLDVTDADNDASFIGSIRVAAQ